MLFMMFFNRSYVYRSLMQSLFISFSVWLIVYCSILLFSLILMNNSWMRLIFLIILMILVNRFHK